MTRNCIFGAHILVLFGMTAIGCATIGKEWEIAKNADTMSSYIAFLDQHSGTDYADSAKVGIIRKAREYTRSQGKILPRESSQLIENGILGFLRKNYWQYSGNLIFQQAIDKGKDIVQVTASVVLYLAHENFLYCDRASIIGGGHDKSFGRIILLDGDYYEIAG
jgi:hypothetical protein